VGLVLAGCAIAAPAAAQASCTTSVTRASAVASIPGDYLALYQKWGGRYGVPWQLLAAVGSVESRHGRDPGAYRPHTRGVLGPMQFQAGSNKAARRVNAAGDQGFGGTWGIWRRSSRHPPYRMDDPDDEIAAAAAKIAFDAGTAHLWPRAIWRYNALHTYRKTVLRRAAPPRHELGLRPPAQVGAGASLAAPARARPAGHGRPGGPGDAAERARRRLDRLRARRRR